MFSKVRVKTKAPARALRKSSLLEDPAVESVSTGKRIETENEQPRDSVESPGIEHRL